MGKKQTNNNNKNKNKNEIKATNKKPVVFKNWLLNCASWITVPRHAIWILFLQNVLWLEVRFDQHVEVLCKIVNKKHSFFYSDSKAYSF